MPMPLGGSMLPGMQGKPAEGSLLVFVNGAWVTPPTLSFDATKYQLSVTGETSSPSFATSPDIRLKYLGDPDAVFSFFCYSHDNVAQGFDAYFTPQGWVASHTSAFLLYKVGGKLKFYGDSGLTKGSVFTPTARGGIGPDGTVTTTAGLGFETGAGGTIAQATSKATTVVLSKSCGTITMNGAALAADTSVSFTLTNTTIAAGDMVLVQHDSVGTLGAYNCTATPAAGSASITVRNLTPGSLSEAIVLRFVVIKAVVA